MALFLWLKIRKMNNETIEQYSKNFNTYLFRLGYAESTIKHTSNDIQRFLSHLQTQNIKSLHEVQPENIHVYNEYLHGLKSRLTKTGLSGSTIQSKINTVKLFSQFLEATEKIKIYATKVDVIQSIKQHKEILSQEQIKQLNGQLQTKSRENIQMQEKVEVAKFSADLDKIVNKADSAVILGSRLISDELKNKKKEEDGWFFNHRSQIWQKPRLSSG